MMLLKMAQKQKVKYLFEIIQESKNTSRQITPNINFTFLKMGSCTL